MNAAIFLCPFPLSCLLARFSNNLVCRSIISANVGGVAGVPPLALGHFQHFAQLLLHLLHVLFLQSGYYPVVVAHAHAYDYDFYDCLCSTYL